MSEKCQLCRQKIRPPRTERLGNKLCMALLNLYDLADGRTDVLIHLSEDKFDRNKFGNFSKLSFFGLAESPFKNGHWKLTADGADFCRGLIRNYTTVTVFDGEISTTTKADYKFIYEILTDSDGWRQRMDFITPRVKRHVPEQRGLF